MSRSALLLALLPIVSGCNLLGLDGRCGLGRVSLVVRESGPVLAELPVDPGVGDLALQSPAFEYTGPVSYDRVFQLAREERLSLVLETSIAETPRIELPLVLYAYHPWSQPYCS